MGLLKLAIFVLLGAYLYQLIEQRLYTRLPINIGGTVDKDFETVKEAFENNYKDGWELEGSSLAVWVKGKQVVNLWGGYSDRAAARVWKEDTIQVTFSSTKGVAAACVAILADRGRLKYDDLVTKHWPGFGKHGKANVTIQQALSHMAGLSWIEKPITEEAVRNHDVMRQILEDEPPKWPPGTAAGYHSITFGWLVDQIIRHTDEKKRGVGQFLSEEITGPNEIDFHIGLPRSEAWRVARIHDSSFMELLPEASFNWRLLPRIIMKNLAKFMDTPFAKTIQNPSWLSVLNPDHYELEQAGSMGIGNANSLGAIFNLFVNEKLVGKKTLDQLEKPFLKSTDLTIPIELTRGHGFFYSPVNRAGTKNFVGHSGYGCQFVGYDLRNRIVISYTTNALKAGENVMCRTFMRLQNAVYDVIETQWIPK